MEEAKEEKPKTIKIPKKVIIIPAIVLVAAALIFAVYSINANHSAGTSISADKKSTSGSSSSLADLISKVPNGIHEAQEQYAFHAGVNTIDIKVGTKDAVVQNISVAAVGNVDRTSAYYIQAVDAALPDLVVGKRIDQINLPRQVSGSSLTTASVNDYLHSLYA